MTPALAADVMRRLGVWWAMGGGWAVDLWLGEQTREHHDVEVVVASEDQLAVRRALVAEWDLFCLDPPGDDWRPWTEGRIVSPAFQLQERRLGSCFDIFLETVIDGTWRFRRDERVTRPLGTMTTDTASGIVVVTPEVQLLYMAKSDEPKNARTISPSPGHAWAQRRRSGSQARSAWRIPTISG